MERQDEVRVFPNRLSSLVDNDSIQRAIMSSGTSRGRVDCNLRDGAILDAMPTREGVIQHHSRGLQPKKALVQPVLRVEYGVASPLTVG